MTKSKEEKQQQQEADAQAQAIEAQNVQENAGIPPNAATSNGQEGNNANVTNANNVPLQTVTSVSPAQAQADAQAQATINQNIQGDIEAHQYNENLSLLKRIVGKASPIVEDVTETESSVDAAGNPVDVPIFKKVTTGYTYYAVNGKPFIDWVKETFGGAIEIDEKENKIIYNEVPQTEADQQKELLKRQEEGRANLEEAKRQERLAARKQGSQE